MFDGIFIYENELNRTPNLPHLLGWHASNLIQKNGTNQVQFNVFLCQSECVFVFLVMFLVSVLHENDFIR